MPSRDVAAKSGKRLRSGGGLRPAAAPCGRLARHAAGAVVAEVGLLGTAPCVGIRDPHYGPASLVDFLATLVANENCSSGHAGNATGNVERNHPGARAGEYARASHSRAAKFRRALS